MRLQIIRVSIYVLFLILALDLVYVQLIRGSYYYNLSVNNRIRVVPMEGRRGIIRDRNGVVLADNRLSFNVSVIPQDVKESDDLFSFLGEILGKDKKELLQKFYQKKAAPFAPVIVAEDIDKEIAMTLEENKFRFPGLYIQETFRRRYPFQSIGAHALGYIGKISPQRIERLKDYGYTYHSIVGYSGVEERYDEYLKGGEGGLQIEVNSRGKQVRLLGVREPESGKDIQLTIDYRIQMAAADALGENSGAIIVMDLDTGELLGMVSAPSFDPNLLVSSQTRNQAGIYFTDPASPLLNRAINAQSPPGSVFKTIVSLAGLSTGKIWSETEFLCPGAFRLGRRRFRCAHVHGTQNLLDAIAHSCNVYFYNVGLLLGPDPLYKYARMMGLGEKTDIDLPFEEKGYVPNPVKRKLEGRSGWYKGDTLNFSIGQGEVLVTPMQAVRMMATIAREGNMMQPHLIKSVAEQEIIRLATIKNISIKKKFFELVKTGLRSAVTDEGGTSRLMDMPGFAFSGKTGTAQTVPGKNNHAWFIGYDLASKPRVAFGAYIEYGGSSYYAVRTMRDMFRRLRAEGAI